MEETEKIKLLEKYMDNLCTAEELRQVGLLWQEPDLEMLWDKIISARSDSKWGSNIRPDQHLLNITAKRKKELLLKISGDNCSERKKNANVLVKKIHFMRHAAIWTGLILLASLIIWQLKETIFQDKTPTFVQRTNPKGAALRFVLPDHSEVFLGAGSTIRYPENFYGNTREMQLSGEAFFQVVHNPEKPFIIHTGPIRTKVLGTSFKIDAFEGQEVSVAVATGKVDVSAVKDGQLSNLALLTPGLKATWNEHTGKIIKDKTDIANLEKWKTGELIFEEQLLSQVISQLERRFQTRITFREPEIARRRIGGTFSSTEPLENILKMLGVVGQFSYEKNTNNRSFIIYK